MKVNSTSDFITEAMENGIDFSLIQATVTSTRWNPTLAIRKPAKVTSAVVQMANRKRAYRVSDYARKIGKKVGVPVRSQDIKRIAKGLGLIVINGFVFGKV